MAWLGKDCERSSGSEPPDMDQVTRQGSDRLDNKQTAPAMGHWAWTQLVWDRAGQVRSWDRTQGLGSQTQVKSLCLSAPVGMVLPQAKEQPRQMEHSRGDSRGP